MMRHLICAALAALMALTALAVDAPVRTKLTSADALVLARFVAPTAAMPPRWEAVEVLGVAKGPLKPGDIVPVYRGSYGRRALPPERLGRTVVAMLNKRTLDERWEVSSYHMTDPADGPLTLDLFGRFLGWDAMASSERCHLLVTAMAGPKWVKWWALGWFITHNMGDFATRESVSDELAEAVVDLLDAPQSGVQCQANLALCRLVDVRPDLMPYVVGGVWPHRPQVSDYSLHRVEQAMGLPMKPVNGTDTRERVEAALAWWKETGSKDPKYARFTTSRLQMKQDVLCVLTTQIKDGILPESYQWAVRRIGASPALADDILLRMVRDQEDVDAAADTPDPVAAWLCDHDLAQYLTITRKDNPYGSFAVLELVERQFAVRLAAYDEAPKPEALLAALPKEHADQLRALVARRAAIRAVPTHPTSGAR